MYESCTKGNVNNNLMSTVLLMTLTNSKSIL